jgi:hypothetical protein
MKLLMWKSILQIESTCEAGNKLIGIEACGPLGLWTDRTVHKFGLANLDENFEFCFAT